MWMIFGIFAIAATLTNLFVYFNGKDHRLFMALGLSFTALTLCAQYAMIASWTMTRDWYAIEDVAPTMSMALWVLTGISIILNLFPVVWDKITRK